MSKYEKDDSFDLYEEEDEEKPSIFDAIMEICVVGLGCLPLIVPIGIVLCGVLASTVYVPNVLKVSKKKWVATTAIEKLTIRQIKNHSSYPSDAFDIEENGSNYNYKIYEWEDAEIFSQEGTPNSDPVFKTNEYILKHTKIPLIKEAEGKKWRLRQLPVKYILVLTDGVEYTYDVVVPKKKWDQTELGTALKCKVNLLNDVQIIEGE